MMCDDDKLIHGYNTEDHSAAGAQLCTTVIKVPVLTIQLVCFLNHTCNSMFVEIGFAYGARVCVCCVFALRLLLTTCAK